jgi:hypothetical protein
MSRYMPKSSKQFYRNVNRAKKMNYYGTLSRGGYRL